jgi:plasmid maintenance system antidote protein VapI
MDTKFSARIARALILTDESNESLAQILGVNKNTISAYKNNRGDLKGIVLVGLAHHFGFNSEWLLTGVGEIYKDAVPKTENGEKEGVTDSAVDELHVDLIKNFKDKVRACRINKNLLEIEDLSPEVFEKVDKYISDTNDTVRLVAGAKATDIDETAPKKKKA